MFTDQEGFWEGIQVYDDRFDEVGSKVPFNPDFFLP
jgi:hypothetical protein